MPIMCLDAAYPTNRRRSMPDPVPTGEKWKEQKGSLSDMKRIKKSGKGKSVTLREKRMECVVHLVPLRRPVHLKKDEIRCYKENMGSRREEEEKGKEAKCLEVKLIEF